MAQAGGDLDLALESLGADVGGEVRMENLDCDRTAVLSILRQVDGRHPPTPDLALEQVALGQGRLELIRLGRQGYFLRRNL